MARQSAFARVAAMDRAELLWRSRAALHMGWERARFALSKPTWDRRVLPSLLVTGAETAAIRTAASRQDWVATQQRLAEWISAAPPRFVIGPTLRPGLVAAITRRFPDGAAHATRRADRLLAGKYDLLGYDGLRFDGAAGTVDWHYDPVHDRHVPSSFWSTVPYLNPASGDHKVIWELNRQQHWLTLGRAYWLTGRVEYRQRALAELGSWLDDNPPLAGVNWASMLELAFRSLSWLWTMNFFADPERRDTSPWLVDLLIALDRQLDHIERHLSHYFSPNTHLIGEALALYVAGRSLPWMTSSRRWADTGRTILINEIARQIAADGGHCERSTHYHRYTLDFYTLALAIARTSGDALAADAFSPAVARLAAAARLLADDNGRLPHLGDDDGGATITLTGRAVDDIGDSLSSAAALVGQPGLQVAAPSEECFWLLAHPTLAPALDALMVPAPQRPIASGALPDTGYYVSRTTGGDHLVVDAGAHGYQNGGHAHADALSLTFSRRGTPLLIDPGTASYTVDVGLRDRMRSSAAHNTLTIDGRSQSTPAGPFHWSHTAHGSARCWRTSPRFDYLEATHDGYAPLEHRRHLVALHDDLLVVADLVTGGAGSHRVDAHWHVAPEWQVAATPHQASLTAAPGRVSLGVSGGVMQTFSGDVPNGLGWHSPVYGRVETATTIRITHSGEMPMWIVSVFGLDPDNEVLAVDTLPRADGGLTALAVAVRIVRARTTDIVGIRDIGTLGSTAHVGDAETDARLLLYRQEAGGAVSRVVVVDGSMVTIPATPPFTLQLPAAVAALDVDPGRLAGFGVATEATPVPGGGGGPFVPTHEPGGAALPDGIH